MSTSFGNDSIIRPPQYRTPSPPRHAYELLSPTTISVATVKHLEYDPKPPNGFRRSPCTSDNDSTNARKYGHRSSASMDVFASIALATQSRNLFQAPPPKRHYIDEFDNVAHPSKRARSEKLRSPEWSRKEVAADTRPATSYEQSAESRMLEAELLLNFSQGARFSCPPISAYHVSIDHANTIPDGLSQPAADYAHQDLMPHQVKDVKADAVGIEQDIEPPILAHGDAVVYLESPEPNIVEDDQPSLSSVLHNTQVPPSYGANDPSQVVTRNLKPVINTTHGIAKAGSEPPGRQMGTGGGTRQGMNISNGRRNSESNVSTGVIQDHEKTLLEQRDILNNVAQLTETEEQVSEGTTINPELEILFGANPEDVIEHESCGRAVHRAWSDERIHLNDDSQHLPDSLINTDAQDNSCGELPLPTLDANLKVSRDTSNNDPDSKLRPDMAIAVCASCNFTRNSISIDSENNATSWISCDGCKSWFHFACAGFRNEREVRSVDKFRCRKCKPIHGATTYVRKSSRAHSAIDYAGLHQGVIKTSDERPEHHYIKPIKDGIITFLPENFARMPPELVTAEYFEKGSGMKEPIVIPANLNPRPHLPASKFFDPDQNSEQHHSNPLEESVQAKDWFPHDPESQNVPDEGQDALDMVMPQGLTVRRVSELYGPEEKVEVIDVKSQNGETKKWNMRRWADYYESPNSKVVRNVISLEVSQSKIGRLIRRPRIVRDLDLQDAVWPEDLLAKGEYPRVQFYCLMSVADCFTDFHIDFGGSSVFYHILKGKKTFLFIPPKEKHLKKYEEWCMSPAQNWTFLADQTKECYRVDLSEGDTMLIPSGWIHAVWTPEDSLVIGGNFLTRMNFGMQLRIAQVEKATGVARKFRYPNFQKLHWYTALRYLEEDPLPDTVKDTVQSGGTFYREKPAHLDFDAWGENSQSGLENYHARYYSQSELEGLPELARYLLRTAMIDAGNITDGITAETRNAVKKSIPRGHGEPIDIIKTFAAWCAWKRGNEPIPYWAYPDYLPDNAPPDRLSAAATKKLDREAALAAPRRQSARMQSLQQSLGLDTTLLDSAAGSSLDPMNQSTPTSAKRPFWDLSTPAQEEMTPSGTSKKPRTVSGAGIGSHRKTACESCRKRRRACKHKDQLEASMLSATNSTDTQTRNTLQSLKNAAQKPPNMFSALFDTSPISTNSIQPLNDDSIRVLTQQPISSRQVQDDVKNQHSEIKPAPDTANRAITTFSGNEDHRQVDHLNSLGPVSGNVIQARPRTKACNECRKSKRRCIHDAFGNEDPVKVAETAIPRPQATLKRRKLSAIFNGTSTPRKAEDALQSAAVNPAPAFARPAVHAVMLPGPAPVANMIAPVANMMVKPSSSDPQPSTANAPILPSIPVVAQPLEPTFYVSETDSLVYETQSTDSNPFESPKNHVNAARQDLVHPVLVTADVPLPREIFAERAPEIQNFFQETLLESRENCEQAAASSLVSPPASSHDDVGDSPEAAVAKFTPSASLSRHSSPQPKQAQRYTPDSGPMRRTSSSSNDRYLAEKATSPQKTGPASSQKQNRARISSETVADEESLKLIKELAAQDRGLRRRGVM